MNRGLTSEASRVSLLSLRERQVVDLMMADVPGKEIAFLLAISLKTVHMYKCYACKKLGVGSTVGLVKFWIRVGLTTAD